MKKQILDAITSVNIAIDVVKESDGIDKLRYLGRLVCEAHEENKETMQDWCNILKAGIELNKPDDKAKSTPYIVLPSNS